MEAPQKLADMTPSRAQLEEAAHEADIGLDKPTEPLSEEAKCRIGDILVLEMAGVGPIVGNARLSRLGVEDKDTARRTLIPSVGSTDSTAFRILPRMSYTALASQTEEASE